MFEYLNGKITSLTPTNAVLDIGNIGYLINISLNTYSQLNETSEAKLFIHEIVREDAHLLYGFSSVEERGIFQLLLSVSGIGANTARMILSALTPEEVKVAITTGNVPVLKNIKGIGAKTAQRVIVDLRDKVGKTSETSEIFDISSNRIKEESLSALATLGFSKSSVTKIVDEIISKNPKISVEDLLREALNRL
ncbi:MAG: Holliday junction branch migration protein RuvA [Bacteroidales bacterium]|nr:Holliday junction branch migration protein RuvA [Bacteroidales bacterium]